jgi:PAP_fibrillin
MIIVVLYLFVVLMGPASSLRISMMGGGPIRGDLVPKLVSLAQQSKLGVAKDYNGEILDIFDRIATKERDFVLRDSKFATKLNGKWELLWTTEKETLLFADKGFFGKPCTRITQTIDLGNGFLNNLIEFEGDRSFSVVGDIQQDAQDKLRLNFQFKKAVISVPPFPSLTLPPIGKGWFETVYVNEKYRLSRDIRGDFLVSKRVN